MIEVRGLAKSFAAPGRGWRWPGRRGRAGARIEAVRDVDFVAADARITALLGPNGAGKSTTLRVVAGLIRPDAGAVAIDGVDVAAAPQRAQARLGVLSDARGLYPRLTARENVVYHARLHGLPDAEAHARCDRLAEMLDMHALLDRRCEGFSQGERMKTALARAMVHDPAHLVLDEPTNGLDVEATRALRGVLRRLRDDDPAAGRAGKCIVLSTHIMQEVEHLADHVVVVAAGRTIAAGTPGELLARTGCDDMESAFVALAAAERAASRAPSFLVPPGHGRDDRSA